ncbi:MAG: hypothetical protein ACX98W_07010 [bacterium]
MMKMSIPGLVAGLCLVAVATSCATGGGSGSGAPQWVMNPDPEGGLVDTQCVRAGAPMGVLKSQAVALARAELGRQIRIRVENLDKLRQELRQRGESRIVEQDYLSASRQFVDQAVAGSRPARVDYVDLRDGEHLCAMVRIDESRARNLFEATRDAAGDSLGLDDDEALWREFQAERTRNELEGSLSDGR